MIFKKDGDQYEFTSQKKETEDAKNDAIAHLRNVEGKKFVFITKSVQIISGVCHFMYSIGSNLLRRVVLYKLDSTHHVEVNAIEENTMKKQMGYKVNEGKGKSKRKKR